MSSTEKLLIDTDVLIDYLKGVSKSLEYLDSVLLYKKCYLSTITVAELYVGVRDGNESQILCEFFQEFEIQACTFEIAQFGGLYRREYGKSHGVGLADALIAATAITIGAQLVTLNVKHFPMLDNLITPYNKIKH